MRVGLSRALTLLLIPSESQFIFHSSTLLIQSIVLRKVVVARGGGNASKTKAIRILASGFFPILDKDTTEFKVRPALVSREGY
jgi:hypothetical protein